MHSPLISTPMSVGNKRFAAGLLVALLSVLAVMPGCKKLPSEIADESAVAKVEKARARLKAATERLTVCERARSYYMFHDAYVAEHKDPANPTAPVVVPEGDKKDAKGRVVKDDSGKPIQVELPNPFPPQAKLGEEEKKAQDELEKSTAEIEAAAKDKSLSPAVVADALMAAGNAEVVMADLESTEIENKQLHIMYLLSRLREMTARLSGNNVAVDGLAGLEPTASRKFITDTIADATDGKVKDQNDPHYGLWEFEGAGPILAKQAVDKKIIALNAQIDDLHAKWAKLDKQIKDAQNQAGALEIQARLATGQKPAADQAQRPISDAAIQARLATAQKSFDLYAQAFKLRRQAADDAVEVERIGIVVHRGTFVKAAGDQLTFKGIKFPFKERTIAVEARAKITLAADVTATPAPATLEDLKPDVYLDVTDEGGRATVIAAFTAPPPAGQVDSVSSGEIAKAERELAVALGQSALLDEAIEKLKASDALRGAQWEAAEGLKNKMDAISKESQVLVGDPEAKDIVDSADKSASAAILAAEPKTILAVIQQIAVLNGDIEKLRGNGFDKGIDVTDVKALRTDAIDHLSKADHFDKPDAHAGFFAAALAANKEVTAKYSALMKKPELKDVPTRDAWQMMIDLHTDADPVLQQALVQERVARIQADRALSAKEQQAALENLKAVLSKAITIKLPASLAASATSLLGSQIDDRKADVAEAWKAAEKAFTDADALLVVIVPDSAKVPEDSDDSNGAMIARPALVARMIELYAHAAFARAMADPDSKIPDGKDLAAREEQAKDRAAVYLQPAVKLAQALSAKKRIKLPMPLPPELAPVTNEKVVYGSGAGGSGSGAGSGATTNPATAPPATAPTTSPATAPSGDGTVPATAPAPTTAP